MEAVIFLSSVTFVIAIGSAIIQGLAFWKRYRVRLHVTSKAATPSSVDLEAMDPGPPIIQQPPLLYHSRLGSRSSRWAYPDRRFRSSRPVSDYRWGPYRIAEEPESGTVAHHPHPLHSSLPATFMPEASTPHD